MAKKNWGMGILIMVLVFGMAVVGCDTGEDNTGGNNTGGNNIGGNNTGGNNTGGNNTGGDNTGGNNGSKNYTFRVKNEASNCNIFRIKAGEVDREGLNIPPGSSSNNISFTRPGTVMSGFHIYVYYDSSYPNIYAAIEVPDDWSSSFELRLWLDGSTFKLSKL
jgi:hypothetical protein